MAFTASEVCYNEFMPKTPTKLATSAQPKTTPQPTSAKVTSTQPETNHDGLVDRLVAWGCQLLHLQKHTHICQQLAKFVIVGVVNTLIDWGVYYLLADVWGWDPLLANIPSFSLATVFSYFASVKWVFDTTTRKTQRRLFIEFVVLNLIALGLTELLLYLLIDHLHLGNMLAKIIATAIVMVFNFITRKLFLEERKHPC